MQFKTKLLLAFLLSAIVPLTAVSLYISNEVSNSFSDTAVQRLSTVREERANAIATYFGTIESQIEVMAQNDSIINAMNDFTAAFNSLPSEIGTPGVNDSSSRDDQLSERRRSVTRYYNNQFTTMLREHNQEGVSTQTLLPRTDSSVILQSLYIAENPHPLGSKNSLDSANDGSRYSEHHQKYHSIFNRFLNAYGYYDIFLVEPEEGNIVYSVYKEIDYATSLKTGPHANSGIAMAFNAALEKTSSDDSTLTDYVSYLPSYNQPASFISTPIFDHETLVGVLIYQMPLDRVNSVVNTRIGLGETGKAYLIGTDDDTFRTQAPFVEQNTVLEKKSNHERIYGAIGIDGSAIYEDYLGNEVISLADYIDVLGLKWLLVVEQDSGDALAALSAIQIVLMIVLSASLTFAFGICFWIIRSTKKQLGADPERLQTVVTAIANNDLDMDLETSKPASGVYADVQIMQKNLRDRIALDKEALAVNGRIRQALNNVNGNVMIVDCGIDIIYVNQALNTMFKAAESVIRNDIGHFDAKALIGSNFDMFYKNASSHPDFMKNLTTTHIEELKLGDRTFRIITNPIFGEQGDRLGSVVEWIDRTQELLVEEEVQRVVDSAQQGNLSNRIVIENKEGFFESLSMGVNQLVSIAERVIEDTAKVLGAIAVGDLTQTIENDYQGSFGKLKQDANASVVRLTEVVGKIKVSAGCVKDGSGEIAQGNTNLSQRTEEQASSLEETASSMEEMTSTVRQNADNAGEANQLVLEVREQAEKGGVVVNQAVTAMDEINSSSKKIADIIGVIDEIAFQTNLLALNASVEAARAGDQGRGFAVVASEVRNLAGRSATAAKEIKDLIEDSGRKVDDGSRLVNESGEMLEGIVVGVKKVTDIVGEIAEASQEQSAGIDEVNKAISQMDELTQQNAALVEQAAAASESLGEEADDLNQLMDFFTVYGQPNNVRTTATNAIITTMDSSAQAANTNDEVESVHVQPQCKSTVNGTDQEWEEF